MFTVGPSTTFEPLPQCSAPSTWPYCVITAVSHVAAAATGAGSCVTPVVKLPTPTGPSSSRRAGMPSRELAGIQPAYPHGALPWSIASFSAGDMAASS